MSIDNLADWGIDVTGRKMRYIPWITDDQGKYKQPDEKEIKAIYGCSGEAVRETLLYFEECGGDTLALITLLNEHVPDALYNIDREVLLTTSRWYTNEYYFYFIMFSKKVIGRYNFHFGENDEKTMLSVHHKFYEHGHLDFVPFGDPENEDITNSVTATIIRGYESLGVDFSDIIDWIDILASKKTALSYRKDVMTVENAWFCGELMYYIYEFFKVLSNDNDIRTIVNKCFDKYNLAGFSFIPETFLLKAMEIILNKSSNAMIAKIKKSGNAAVIDLKSSPTHNEAKFHNLKRSVNENISNLLIGVYGQIIKKLLNLNELPVVSDVIIDPEEITYHFKMEWQRRKLPIPYLWLLIINIVGISTIVLLRKYIPINAYSVLSLLAINVISLLVRRFNITRKDKKNAEEQFQKILFEYEQRLDEVASISQNLLREKQQLIVAKDEAERRLKITEIYTRRSLVEIIEKGGDPTNYEPNQQNVSILFADIRDFTGISEKLQPFDLVNFLNKYFDRMNNCIISNKGEIDKLIGDCIMAVFRDADSSLKAAIDMRKELDILNREQGFPDVGLKDTTVVNIGTGINSGSVVVGNIGSKSKMDYTLIGDIVNVASRCEALTKFYNVPIIISQEVKNELKGSFNLRFLDIVQVKGKERPIRIFEVYDCHPDDIIDLKNKIQPQLNTAFDYYLEGHFLKAGKIYEELISTMGTHSYMRGKCADPVLHFYQNRCKNLFERQKAGLLQEWKGIYEFVDK